MAAVDESEAQSADATDETIKVAEPPENLHEVGELVMNTLGGMWSAFIAHLPLLAIGLVTLLLTWIVSGVGERIARRAMRNRGIRLSLQELIVRLVVIVVWVLGLLVTAMIIFPGLTPASALGGLGLLSLAIGFAFKDIFENFFAGILILWRFPFEPGDYIEADDISGSVEEITVRNTLIRRTTGELVVVPNSHIFKNPVDVLTNRTTRRETIMAGVAYDVDLAAAVKVIEEAVNGCESVDKNKPVQVFPHGFGSSSMDIEVTWWSGAEPVEQRSSRGEVVLAIKQALDANDMEIPFPYRTLTFKEPLPLQRPDDASAES